MTYHKPFIPLHYYYTRSDLYYSTTKYVGNAMYCRVAQGCVS